MRLVSAGALGLVAFGVAVSPLAGAADSGWYAGGNIGLSNARIDDAGIRNGLLGSGFTVTGIEDDERGLGSKFFGGYQFGHYFALEGGIFDLGVFSFDTTTAPAGTFGGRLKAKGLNMDVVGILPIVGKYSGFGRVGATYAVTDDSFEGSGLVSVRNASASKRELNLKVGLGIQYAFSPSWAVRAEGEYYRINDAVGRVGDISLVSVGVIYQFDGNTKSSVPIRVRADDTSAPYVTIALPNQGTLDVSVGRRLRLVFNEPMDSKSLTEKTITLSQGPNLVPGSVTLLTPTTARFTQMANLAPDTQYVGRVKAGVRDLVGNAMASDYVWTFKTGPLPDAKVVTRPVVLDKFVLLEDTHFEFGHAALTRSGVDIMKQNIQTMKNNPTLNFRIAGYTSAAGTSEYNQDLSERRADVVMAYIINEGGIAPERLDAIGYGETRPAVYEPIPSDTESEAARANMRVIFEVIVKH